LYDVAGSYSRESVKSAIVIHSYGGTAIVNYQRNTKSAGVLGHDEVAVFVKSGYLGKYNRVIGFCGSEHFLSSLKPLHWGSKAVPRDFVVGVSHANLAISGLI
jgi:hypothetical protein